MRRLIIGCGYLGERVAHEWLSGGDEVYVLTRSKERAARFAESGFKPLVGDVLEVNSLQGFPQVETILYAVGFDRTSQHSKRMVYVEGLRNVLNAVRGRTQRFVYVSSTSVYGQDNAEEVDEFSTVSPSEENGRICRDAEALVWEHFRQATEEARSGDAIVLRLAGIYGPGRLLAREQQLLRGELLSGNPEAWLNLIHVEDGVQAVLAAERHGQTEQTYLVCDDRPLRRREFYQALATRLGAAAPKFAELAVDSPERRQLNKRCMNRRMREELGVELRFPTVIEGLSHLFAERP
jgi:nucleoside-diphosphate-sugar epimerase